MNLTLNIGLAIPDTKLQHSPKTAREALADLFPIKPIEYRTAMSGTEETLIAEMDIDSTEFSATVGKLYILAKTLQQDCIAYSLDGGITGELVGPNASAWGDFNAQFFIPFEEIVNRNLIFSAAAASHLKACRALLREKVNNLEEDYDAGVTVCSDDVETLRNVETTLAKLIEGAENS